MKRILGAVLVLVAVIFGSNYYYGRQVEKHLDSAALFVRAMGGNLEYSGVTITLGGDIRIEGVRASAPELGEDMSVERIVLRTGSVLGVHKLATEVRKNRLPQQLGLSFEGVRIFLIGAGAQEWNTLAPQGSESLSAAGCGDRTQFLESDYTAMGYNTWLMMDSHIDYRLLHEGEWLELEVQTVTEDMHDISMKMDFTLNAASREMAAIGMAMAGAQLNEVRVDYNDKGYAERVIEFCQQQTELGRKEFLVHHLEAWQEAWKSIGFVAGENTVAAYRQFLVQPEHFAISAKPTGSFSWEGMEDIAPELLLYQFQIALEVNGVAAGRLDLTPMDQAAKRAWRVEHGNENPSAEPAPESSTGERPVQRRGKPRAVAVEDLGAHLNDYVILELSSGRTVEGRIRRLNEDALQLEGFQSGGTMTIPVPYGQIVKAYLK